MLDGVLYAFRDPLGIKPLCLGEFENGGHIVASESVALDAVGAKLIRDVAPGESIRLMADKVYTVCLSTSILPGPIR